MKIQQQFTEVISLIKRARYDAFKAVNKELINLYWELGKYINQRTESEGWGKSTVLQLAEYIQKQEPELKGFSDKNLWRMKQFYETYKENAKLATLWRVLLWSHNKLIFPLKNIEEREFYLNLSVTAIPFLQTNHVDLVFSDIELLDGNAFDIYNQVQVLCPIIFTTAYNQFWMNAFETNGIAYLLKPYSKEQFQQAWDKFIRLKHAGQQQDNQLHNLTLLVEKQLAERSYKKSFLVHTHQEMRMGRIPNCRCN